MSRLVPTLVIRVSVDRAVTLRSYVPSLKSVAADQHLSPCLLRAAVLVSVTEDKTIVKTH